MYDGGLIYFGGKNRREDGVARDKRRQTQSVVDPDIRSPENENRSE